MSKPVEPIVIVGSGACAVHFAQSLLEKGYRVRMLDVGRSGPTPPHDSVSFRELKDTLPDPVAFFLGERFEDVVLPRENAGYNMRWPWLWKTECTTAEQRDAGFRHGFPQQFDYVFGGTAGLELKEDGFAPVVSFAQGGLAEAWAAGAFPFNGTELEAFPFSYAEIEPYYNLVARRIGISGAPDDLATFSPVHDHMQPPLELTQHASMLLAAYDAQRTTINDRLGCYLGRSRVATLTSNLAERRACSYLGRCLSGCPTGSIYAPRFTLSECRKFDHFEYLPGWYVSHFCTGPPNRVASLVANTTHTNRTGRFDVGTLVLCTGTISTGRIMLESIYRQTGRIERLTGLMDTRMILVPFISPGMLCRQWQSDAYQFHQLAFTFGLPETNHVAHGQITTMTGTAVHAAVQNMGLDIKASLFAFQHARSAMGLAMVALPDERRTENYLTLELPDGSGATRLVAHYRPARNESRRIRWTIRKTVRLLRKLGCIVARHRIHVRPMGKGIHYAGTLPMSATTGSHRVAPDCCSFDFENLFIVDGSTFPSLPAKGSTLSLMANAARVADQAF